MMELAQILSRCDKTVQYLQADSFILRLAVTKASKEF